MRRGDDPSDYRRVNWEGLLTPETLTHLAPLFDTLDLTLLDYQTIRDLLELGDYPDEPDLAAGLALLLDAMSQGSLCLPLVPDTTDRRLAAPAASASWQRFAAGLHNGRYHRLAGTAPAVDRPLVVRTDDRNGLLYFQKLYVHEQRLQQRVEELLATGRAPLAPDAAPLIATIYTPESVIRSGRPPRPITRDPHQVAALELVLTHPLAIVSGGPGTGKTSLMVNMLRCLVRAGVDPEHILLAAPTGRAAQRMTEALTAHLGSVARPSGEDRALSALEGHTLHRALHYRHQENGFYHCRARPLPAAVVVVDEISMVDLFVLERFLDAVDPTRTRVVLMGDKDQLPSVAAGAVFAEMIPRTAQPGRFTDRLVMLRTVYRSGEALQRLAAAVNRGRDPGLNPVPLPEALDAPDGSWRFVTSGGEPRRQHDLQHWTEKVLLAPDPADGRGYADLVAAAAGLAPDELLGSEPGRRLLDELLHHLQHARILTLTRRGTAGAETVNRLVGHYLAQRCGQVPDPLNGAFSGGQIVVAQNDYRRGLFNGDLGVVIAGPDGILRTYFAHARTAAAHPVDMLGPWQPAFALTVHKAQGSEFDQVLLMLPEDPQHRLLSREIVYTGVTRARRRVWLYGPAGSLRTALARRIERRSGLAWQDGAPGDGGITDRGGDRRGEP
jgi:exodeoxyribonuclease V alpha subunit